ncbi:hypothetical protein C8R47DRAFT_1213202 [Mycena vitilis]|nr:hypothetical protein C8R47DRAFT_1231139 [Mycena vitilis]KAJ6495722.1 hypothetical protein C8R47DRAFT_1213202 [Mycena vitilis]
MFPLPRNASGVRDEFLHLDFPVPGELYNFSQHPFMASVTRQLLEPLYLAFIHVRDDWTWPIEARNPDERISMRKNTREYFELAARLSDLIIQHKALARDRRFPAPRVSWMQIVMRADAAYGFEGDEDAITRTILKGKLASVFRYADMLCHRAYERSTKAEALRRANGRPARGAAMVPEEGLAVLHVMDSFPYTQNRTVSQVVSVDPMVQSQLEFFRTAHVERHEYASSRNGHIQYLTQWVRPFAALIQCCIPLGALSSAEMPEGRVEFLQPYVVSYIEKAALLYSIALDRAHNVCDHPFIDSSASWSLSLAKSFDIFADHPVEGFAEGARSVLLGRIAGAASLAGHLKAPGSILDVPIPPEILSLRSVPSWPRLKIAELLHAERSGDVWACENALLRDEIELSSGLARSLDKAASYVGMDFSPSPYSRYSV